MKPTLLVGGLAAVLLAAVLASADDFPPVTAADRALKEAPGHPGAPAMVLLKKAEFTMADIASGASSRLRVLVRLKVLKEAGREWGDVQIRHSELARLHDLSGRTVAPDGTVAPLPKDARFKRKLSTRDKRFVTSIAFPAVEVGSILDYRYEIAFDSIYFLEPWTLSETVPVRRAEITWRLPEEISARAWARNPGGVAFKNEKFKEGSYRGLRVWAEDLPAVPDEPFAAPFNDLAASFLLVPLAYSDPMQRLPLLEDWPQVAGIYRDAYAAAAKGGAAAARAKVLVAGATTPRARAEALYAFVRDQIATEEMLGVSLRKGSTVDTVLKQGTGDFLDKALLLEALLKSQGLDARVTWAADRSFGTIDASVPTPSWFQRAVVTLELDGKRVFLDPSERTLAFGHLPAELQGSAGYIVSGPKPEGIVFPMLAPAANQRLAGLELALDAAGRVSGTGELLLTGEEARREMDLETEPAKRTERWQQWLERELPDFRVADVRMADSPEARQVRVLWSLKHKDEAVLGDQASLQPSRPLGPLKQPFTLPAAARRSAVYFDFPYRDEVALRLRWPAGWRVGNAPPAQSRETAAGLLSATMERDDAARTIVYRRRLEVRKPELVGAEEYEAVRQLFELAERQDAQALVLVRR
jgi:transglutaminase-like putative cysteine protease